MIVLQVELMEPELAKDDAEKRGGKLLRQLGWLSQTPGDGVVCLYSFASLANAQAFVVDCFGDDPDSSGQMTETVEGVFYTHQW